MLRVRGDPEPLRDVCQVFAWLALLAPMGGGRTAYQTCALLALGIPLVKGVFPFSANSALS